MMAATPISPPNITGVYRTLYRRLLHAVQYSKPSRYVARNQLRHAFRKGNLSDFNQHKMDNTIEFLRLAALENGLEHRILKNLLRCAYERELRWKFLSKKQEETATRLEIERTAWIHYDMTVAMLNDTMGLCLK